MTIINGHFREIMIVCVCVCVPDRNIQQAKLTAATALYWTIHQQQTTKYAIRMLNGVHSYGEYQIIQ